MKKVVIAASFIALFAVSAAMMAVQAQAKPAKGMVVGDVIELSTYAIKGHGEGSAETYKTRAEQGFPVGILEDETGEIWICVFRSPAPASHLETANKHLLEYMGKKVAVQGLKYKADGVNVIRFSVISEY
ncbi:MAG: hypothetical protein COA73_12345 [Candidatus Hydrogenedentota bacterium]|nr:MAG: hypothetical protein COA73_12345 [Candidatus Hydrogenedentota bacterium]